MSENIPHDEELDVEAPNESAPGHNPEETDADTDTDADSDTDAER
jgi:hypothetical protein